MLTRLLSGTAAALIVYVAGAVLGMAVAPKQPKIIASVVAHAHAPSAWVAAGSPHGL